MKQCFCGCGRTVRRFPLGLRSVNTRARLVRERLDWAMEICADLDPAWVEEGRTFLLELRGAVHGEIDAAQVNQLEPQIREWQGYGRELERQALLSGAPPLRRWLASRG